MAYKNPESKAKRVNLLTIGSFLSGTILLASCGGGGGTPTLTTVTQTVTCPNGTSKSGTAATTAAALDAATAQCATPQLASVSPTNGATAVSVDTFTSVEVTTDSTLDASTVTNATVTLTADTVAVAGIAVAVGTKGFKFTPTAKLGYGKTYAFTATVKDTLGKALTVGSAFTTALISCTSPKVANSTGDACVDPAPPVCPSPSVWTTGINACVYPMGVKVYLDKATAPAGAATNATFPGQTQSGLLPPECLLTGDACWQEAVRNGTIEFTQTTARNLLQPTRPIAFGAYKTVDTIFFPGQTVMMYCSKPFFADDGTTVIPSEKVENYCNTWEEVFHMGNDLGLLLQARNPNTGVTACYQKKFVQNPDGWATSEVSCP